MAPNTRVHVHAEELVFRTTVTERTEAELRGEVEALQARLADVESTVRR